MDEETFKVEGKKKEIRSEKIGIPFRLKERENKANKYVIGSTIFIWCLIFLFVIYFVDIILGVMGLKIYANNSGEVLEIIKMLLFTICGYLFGKNEKNIDDCEKKEQFFLVNNISKQILLYEMEREPKRALFSYATNDAQKTSERRYANEYGGANPGYGSCAGCGRLS